MKQVVTLDTNSENIFLDSLIKNASASLIPFLESVSLSNRQHIYSPCDSFDYIYFPETAVVSESQILENGRIVEIAMIGKESAAGVLSLMHTQNAVNCVRVLIEGRAYRIKKHILRKHFSDNQSLQPIYWKFVQNYTAQISNRIACVTFHTLKQRLASWILMIQNRTGRNEFELTHEQLGDALGVHRPSITLLTVELKKENIIDYLRGKIIINDKPALEMIACNCCENVGANQLVD